MKLWLLRPIEDWMPWYDKAFGFVVRAKTEEDARHLVFSSGDNGEEGAEVWRDALKTTCEELKKDGKEEIIIQDFSNV